MGSRAKGRFGVQCTPAMEGKGELPTDPGRPHLVRLRDHLWWVGLERKTPTLEPTNLGRSRTVSPTFRHHPKENRLRAHDAPLATSGLVGQGPVSADLR